MAVARCPAVLVASSESGGFDQDRRNARRWLALAVMSLVIAGFLAALLVIARTPPLNRFVTDPAFFKRCLVVHVNLSLVVWFLSFLAVLFYLVPSRSKVTWSATPAWVLACLGVALLVMGAAIPSATPILSNYVPMIDHPIFAAGLASIGAGLALTFLDFRVLPGREAQDGLFPLPGAARIGIRAAVVLFFVALLTVVAAALSTPGDLLAATRYELVFWGGGHVLQAVSVAGMLSAWAALLAGPLDRSPVGRRAASVLFFVLVLPFLFAPLLAMGDMTRPTHGLAFTRLMQWGIFPVVLVFLALCLRALARAPRSVLRQPRVWAFGASALLTILGFVLGALIRGSNTMIPAHYHASIGAVTVAYMALACPLLEGLGHKIPSRRLAGLSSWQPPLLGIGQLTFACGFALAGASGMQRKAYGQEQHVRTVTEHVGLGLMGLGGLVAILGGILFLWIVGAAFLGERRRLDEEGKVTWETASIRSKS
ncbi:MAG: cbb3-type cytochrome c oxidase subunit I [Deltaproteobacteria bacterium]|nr:cbb3-type cytochrome c oxidase subunit I [Deltaproteobacteria bacterium]